VLIRRQNHNICLGKELERIRQGEESIVVGLDDEAGGMDSWMTGVADHRGRGNWRRCDVADIDLGLDKEIGGI
jgi:hypothetical protein